MRPLVPLVCSIALVAGCGRSSFDGANVLLIGIDTLRADHLGCYGYPRPTSPRIDALAAEGVVFETAIAQSPWTLPSFASMFTGLLPSRHRAGEGQSFSRSRLDPRFASLPKELQRAGWRTGSFVSNGYVGKNVGLADGFETHWQWLDSRAAVEQAERFLRAHARERFFAFVHLVDPHQPYAPPRDDAAFFVDPAYQGQVGTSFGGFARADFTDADRRRIVDLYDGEVRVSDRYVGRLVDLLRELGVLERTIVVVVADHGEELFEHGFLGHGHSLRDELLHVPFVVRFPGARWAGRIGTQVRMIDLFPTVLDALGLPIPPDLDGVSRMALVRGEPPAPDATLAIAEFLFIGSEQKAVRRNDFKLIYTPVNDHTVAYDLVKDPGETVDVASERAGDVTPLRAVLEHEVLKHIEGFQIAARSGEREHLLRLRLESPTGFSDVGLVDFDEGDAVTTSEDGRTVEVTFRLPATDGERPDDDIVRFQVADGEPFTLTAELDGTPFEPRHFLLGRFSRVATGTPPWKFTVDDPRLVVEFPPVLPPARTGEVRAALYRVHRPPPPVTALDEKTRESLRQLGYIQ